MQWNCYRGMHSITKCIRLKWGEASKRKQKSNNKKPEIYCEYVIIVNGKLKKEGKSKNYKNIYCNNSVMTTRIGQCNNVSICCDSDHSASLSLVFSFVWFSLVWFVWVLVAIHGPFMMQASYKHAFFWKIQKKSQKLKLIHTIASYGVTNQLPVRTVTSANFITMNK